MELELSPSRHSEAAQAVAGLVLPELAGLGNDLGDGVRGVTLPEAGIARARRARDRQRLAAGSATPH